MNELKEYIFTFGHGQLHFGRFVAIKAKDSNEAREEMFRRYGRKWSMQYDSREKAGVERWNLKELK
jgi:hypothetical protein